MSLATLITYVFLSFIFLFLCCRQVLNLECLRHPFPISIILNKNAVSFAYLFGVVLRSASVNAVLSMCCLSSQAFSGLDRAISRQAKLSGNTSLNAVLNTQFLVQIGVFTAVPMIMGFILELGLLKVSLSNSHSPPPPIFLHKCDKRQTWKLM